MKVVVDPDTCLGCGICEGLAPDVFSLGAEPYAIVLLNPVPAEHQAAVRDAAEQCPEEAILIEE
jgi:ferredoxin